MKLICVFLFVITTTFYIFNIPDIYTFWNLHWTFMYWLRCFSPDEFRSIFQIWTMLHLIYRALKKKKIILLHVWLCL